MELQYDVLVVGAGHAGCEAAAAAARMGCRTCLLTINLDNVAQMSCNPAIGGLAKGQIVREVDALGGEMAKVTDEAGIQFRLLNTGKGPAVHAPRAQCDKRRYQREMKLRLEIRNGLMLRQEVVEDLIVEDGRIAGLRTASGLDYRARAVVLTTGTFLKGVIHVGARQTAGGRMGEPSAEGLSDGLRALGLEVDRLKTGTPPRINARTIDYGRCRIQPGDALPVPFSFRTPQIHRPQVPCYVTATNPVTHEIIRRNLDRAPLYTGQIKSVGPRYCPSVETKIDRFPDRECHMVYLEPEGLDTLEVYCNGLATSIPQDVQEEMLHSIRGLERAEIMRYGYAIEYDYVPPTQITPALECKLLPGLFLAGQINGTSGYEEAAGQGIVAGINAALKTRGAQPFVLGRHEAYVGVMIDDLVTRGVTEPYRMFTSRAEYRLLLRHDNADRRLMPVGRRFGLIDDATWDAHQRKVEAIEATRQLLRKRRYGASSLEELLRRPENTFADVAALDEELKRSSPPALVAEAVEIEIKYEGYIRRQNRQIEKFRKMESKRLPEDIDYSRVPSLRAEASQVLSRVRPASLGQASRAPGITPADIAMLHIYLEGLRGSRTPPDA